MRFVAGRVEAAHCVERLLAGGEVMAQHQGL
jgi:hypothetical protein